MIKIIKRLMPYCEECEDINPYCTKIRDRTEDGKSYDFNIVVMCQNADICSQAVHRFSSLVTSDEQLAAKKNETISDVIEMMVNDHGYSPNCCVINDIRKLKED